MRIPRIPRKEKLIDILKSMIFENFRIKLICFLMAIAVYFSVGYFQRSTKTYTSELKIEKLKDFLVISNPIPDTIKITAKDKQSVFDKITVKDFNVRLDLSDVKGPESAKIKLKWDIPKNMTSFFSSIKVEPDEISIKVEKLVEKNVRIDLVRYGEPAKGYIVKKITIDPTFIRIQGPKSLLENITAISTETVNIEGAKESFGRQLNVIPESNRIKPLGKVYVFFEITLETDEKSFRFNRVFFENLKPQFKASINRIITVKIEGPKLDMPNFDQDYINLIVDCSSIVYPGEYPLEIKIKVPENYKLISIIPEKITVTVEDRQG